MGKGDNYRKVDKQKFNRNYEQIFRTGEGVFSTKLTKHKNGKQVLELEVRTSDQNLARWLKKTWKI